MPAATSIDDKVAQIHVVKTIENSNAQFLAAIARKQNIGEATRNKYERAVIRATEAGGDLKDAQQLASYAVTLPKSSRQFLRAAVLAWTKDATHLAKSNATPENVNAITAALYRLDALAQSIQAPSADNGTKAHIWLTRPQVAELISKPDTTKVIGRRDKPGIGTFGWQWIAARRSGDAHAWASSSPRESDCFKRAGQRYEESCCADKYQTGTSARQLVL